MYSHIKAIYERIHICHTAWSEPSEPFSRNLDSSRGWHAIAPGCGVNVLELSLFAALPFGTFFLTRFVYREILPAGRKKGIPAWLAPTPYTGIAVHYAGSLYEWEPFFCPLFVQNNDVYRHNWRSGTDGKQAKKRNNLIGARDITSKTNAVGDVGPPVTIVPAAQSSFMLHTDGWTLLCVWHVQVRVIMFRCLWATLRFPTSSLHSRISRSNAPSGPSEQTLFAMSGTRSLPLEAV